MLGTNEQTAKISKTGFAKIGHIAVSKPQWVGFSSKKTGCDKFESLKKNFFIPLPHQSYPYMINLDFRVPNDCFLKKLKLCSMDLILMQVLNTAKKSV